MEINKKNRTDIKSYFLTNKIPTQKNFEEFIDAGLNQAEDGIIKMQGNPLAIQAEGDVAGMQENLHFYKSFASTNPDWAINLNPRVDPNVPTSNKPGLNIKDGGGTSRLFIKSTGGYVGIGTIEPTSKLSIKATKDESLISVTGNYQGNPKIFEVKQESSDGALYVRQAAGDTVTKLSGYPDRPSFFMSNVGIGIQKTDANLHIMSARAELRIKNTDANNWAFISIKGNGPNYWDIAQYGNNGTLEFRPKGGDANRLIMGNDGALQAPGGLMIGGNRKAHWDLDGTFYRYGGQAYLTVDDNLYIRDAGTGTKMHFQTNDGRLSIGGSNPEAPLSISGDGKEATPNGVMHLTNDCILFGGNNNGRELNSAQISAGKHIVNSLNIVGMSSGASHVDRKIDLWAEGGMTVYGTVTANSFSGEGSNKLDWKLGFNDKAASTGTWTPVNGGWGEPKLHENAAYTSTAYPKNAGTETMDFKIPEGAKTAYLSTLGWSSTGYFDIMLKMGGVWKFHRRINDFQDVTTVNSGGTHDGNHVTMAATGLDHFKQIRIQARKGRIHFTGIGFSKEDMTGSYEMGMMHQDNIVTPHIIKGMIIMWTGATAPSGWALCDGASGTPDLRGRFILGQGNGSGLTARNLKAKGGAESVTLNQTQIPAHVHGMLTRQDDYNVSGGQGPSFGKDNGAYRSYHNTASTGGGKAHGNMPPFFVLAFIMKL